MGLRKKILMAGIAGQGGSYRAELLLAKGAEVHGIKRRMSSLMSAVATQKSDAVWCAMTGAASIPRKWKRYWVMQAKLENGLAGLPASHSLSWNR